MAKLWTTEQKDRAIEAAQTELNRAEANLKAHDGRVERARKFLEADIEEKLAAAKDLVENPEYHVKLAEDRISDAQVALEWAKSAPVRD